jgi:hypothetical protein
VGRAVAESPDEDEVASYSNQPCETFSFSEGSAAVRSCADATNLLDESSDCRPLDLVFCFIVARGVGVFAACPLPPESFLMMDRIKSRLGPL